jgi:plasmid stability protein
MADLLIQDLDPHALDLLERRASASGRSLQAETKRILELAARACDEDAARDLADRISAELAGRSHPDSAGLIREVRDR